MEATSIHQYNFTGLDGKPVNFANFSGKVLLIVNTASKCGFTPQLMGLENLYQTYKTQGFEIIAFPSNQFGGQEPLDNNGIGNFCQKNYGVSFPIMQKSDVKGKTANPVYQFLSSKKINGTLNSKPKWNFHKYIVDKKGKVRDYFYSTTAPESKKIARLIEKLLLE